MAKITFEQVVEYAEKVGCEHRGELSRATNYTHRYFRNHWMQLNMMVLYEAPRRILKGHDKPEVCWWCITPDGRIHSIASRHLRMMDELRGFALWEEGYDLIMKTLNGIIQEEI